MRRGYSEPREKKGFTLVELVVVMIILSVGLITLLLVLRNAAVTNAHAHLITIAGELGQGRIERILSDRKTEGFDYIESSNYPQETSLGYTIDTDIHYVALDALNSPLGDASNYKRVEVNVNKASMDIDITFVTLVSNY